jgi:hypothetical protein
MNRVSFMRNLHNRQDTENLAIDEA